jgi:hypothetical protein
MAECKRIVCTGCARAFDVWSDGNPYYLDDQGKKQYAYHPDHENLARCIGNDSPHICLGCGAQRKVDSRKPRSNCPKCRTGELVHLWELEGRQCPFCSGGIFERDVDYFAIS